jgi:magnesium transporter
VDSLRRVPSHEAPSEPYSDISNPSIFSKAFQNYDPQAKYTYYATGTDIRQAWTIEGLLRSEERPADFLSGEIEPFWLDVFSPSIDDLSQLARTFGVHPLTVEDVQMGDSREKCEIFEKYLLLCIQTCGQIRRTSLDNDESTPETLYILVFQKYIISVHQQPIPHIRRVLRRLYGLRSSHHLSLTADWVMYSLLDDAVDEFQPQMQTLQHEVDTIDELVLFLTHTEQHDMLRRIGRARKRLTHLLRLLKPKTEILKVLTKRCPDYLCEHTIIYLRDVNDHVLTNLQNLDQYAETLNRSHSNYLAQISIELNEASNRMNIVMKKLTAAAALVLPLSLISGIWGMNVPVPGQSGIEGFAPLLPFFAIVLFMCVLMGAMYYIGHKHDWW